MGTLVGHVGPGLCFFLIGLWHLFNHIKLHSLNPTTYQSLPWFPTTKIKYLELLLIMGGASTSVAAELFIGPMAHQPLAPDGSIPSNHLHNVEHASISFAFFAYAALAAVLHRLRPPAGDVLTNLLGATAFAQQLLLFRLHSTDHTGVEGQYHLLLQLVAAVSLAATLSCAALPSSFAMGFVRSLSVLFQGVWLVVMGLVLWTPRLVPKGCFIHAEEGHRVVRCDSDEQLRRAKALVNIQFSWLFVAAVVSAVCFYLVMHRIYGCDGVAYRSLPVAGYLKVEDQNDNVE